MLLADWIDALADLPKEAVERAVHQRIRSDERSRPLPGEVRRRALAFITGGEREAEPPPFAPPAPLTDEQLARRRQIAAEYGFTVHDGGVVKPRVKRMTTSEVDL